MVYRLTTLIEDLKTKTWTNMAKLSKDIAILHTQFCEDYVAKDLVASIDYQTSSPAKPIISSPPEVIVSSPSCAPTPMVNAPAPCLETLP